MLLDVATLLSTRGYSVQCANHDQYPRGLDHQRELDAIAARGVHDGVRRQRV